MLRIKRFICNMLQENCYVVSDETNECVIIDCGAMDEEEFSLIRDYIVSEELTPVHLLATHGHIDHNFGNAMVYKEYGLKVEVHENDKSLMAKLAQQALQMTGIKLQDDFPSVGKYLHDNDKVSFGSHAFTVIETPGHSRGSVFLYDEEEHVAFSGDTLFQRSIGRTDFEGGSMFQMIQSLRMICQLPDITRVYPGHGPETTIGAELASNPYLDR